MAGTGATHYRWDDLPKETLKPDLQRRLIPAERMTIGHVYLQKGLHEYRSAAGETRLALVWSQALERGFLPVWESL